MSDTNKSMKILLLITIMSILFTCSTSLTFAKGRDEFIPPLHKDFMEMIKEHNAKKDKAEKIKKAKIEKAKADRKAKQVKKVEKTTQTTQKSANYRTLKITEYCKACNTPANSTATASGRWCPNYSVASSDYALGTKLYIEGIGERRVDDTGCRSGIVDLLTDCNGGCHCDLCTHRKVWVIK